MSRVQVSFHDIDYDDAENDAIVHFMRDSKFALVFSVAPRPSSAHVRVPLRAHDFQLVRLDQVLEILKTGDRVPAAVTCRAVT